MWLLPPESLSDTLFWGAAAPIISDTVAHVAGITGCSSPAPDGGDADLEGRSVRAKKTVLPGDNRGRVPHQSPSLNERGRKTERSREESVTR